MWPEIGPISRVVHSSSPRRLASHGGAAGKSANVANPIPASSATQPTYRRKRSRAKNQSNPASSVRRHEVAHVDGPGRVVVPAQVRRPVPEPVLQPDGRDRAAEEKGIGLELRPIPGREEQAVGVTAQQVVGREHERERQPFEDDAAQPAPEIRRREREQAEHDDRSRRSRPTGMPSRHMYALSAAT